VGSNWILPFSACGGKKKKKKLFAFQYHGKQFKTGIYLKSENRSRAQPARILIILRLYVLIAIYNFIYHQKNEEDG
jgi:hypothetical protein